MESYLSADEAVALIGVSKQTLYAYVSRGKVKVRKRDRGLGNSYCRRDLERLLTRKSRGRKPTSQAMTALEEGWPVLQTGLSHVHGGELFYRDQSAIGLAETADLESVARLLWQFGEVDPFAEAPPPPSALWIDAKRALARRPIAERALTLLALAQESIDSAAWLTQPVALAHACASLLRFQVAGLLGQRPSARPLHQQIARAWKLDPADAEVLRAILVLLADHEMNVLGFAGRCVASTGATLGASLLAALSGMSGTLRGGAFAQVEAMWDELLAKRDLAAAIRDRLDRGEALPGFYAHSSHPDGDPRARWLLSRPTRRPETMKLAANVRTLTGLHPSLDFAVVSVRRAMGWPPEAAFMLIHGARTVGLIAHILEQRRDGRRIWPMARYVGPRP
jgi:citrate synthase